MFHAYTHVWYNIPCIHDMHYNPCIAGIFRGPKFFLICGFGAIRESFNRKNFWWIWWRYYQPGMSLSFLIIRKSFSRKYSTFSNSRKFLPAKDSHYTVYSRQYIPYLRSVLYIPYMHSVVCILCIHSVVCILCIHNVHMINWEIFML